MNFDDLSAAMENNVKQGLENINKHGFPNITATPDMMPYHMQNWPEWIAQHSPIRSCYYDLSPDEVSALISVFGDEATTDHKDLLKVRLFLQCGLQVLGGKAFLRLGSRSPKDSYYRLKDDLSVETPDEAFNMAAGSERFHVDLQSYRTAGLTPRLYLREWVASLKERNEYRCYVLDGRLVGISQYQYRCPEAPDNTPEEVLAGIKTLWGKMQADWNRDLGGKGVFDVWFDQNGVHLLEINPPYQSDPCLFKKWEFDDTLRIGGATYPINEAKEGTSCL